MNTSQLKKILIVEDDTSLRQALTDKFKFEGFEVIKVENGEKGLESAINNHPDIILLDILMPKMDGMTLMRKLREDEWGRKVPIILLTNVHPDDKILNQVVDDLPSYYLIKSNSGIEEVVSKVKEVLKMASSN